MLAMLMTVSSLTFAQEKVDRMPKISGFVQGLYQADFNQDFDLQENTFRARRVRLSVSGNLTKNLTYKIQGDFSRSPMLVDALVKYKFNDAIAIQAGQFKIPFTMETAINPLNLEIFDYGEVISKMVGYKDVCGVGAIGRDLGIMVSGKLFKVESNSKEFHLVEYAAGVFNGNGANVVDNNNRKDISARIEFHPWLKDLTLTGSIYNGEFAIKEKNKDTVYGDRNRWSFGAQFKNEKVVVRAEYVGGETGQNTSLAEFDNLKSTGYYAVAGYNFNLGKNKTQVLMPVLRYDYMNENTDGTDKGKNIFTVGVNYWPIGCLNFKLDYSLISPESGDKSHRIAALLSYKF